MDKEPISQEEAAVIDKLVEDGETISLFMKIINGRKAVRTKALEGIQQLTGH